MRVKSLIAAVSLVIGFIGVVAGTPAQAAEADIHAALQRWAAALGSGKGEAPIAALYAPDAVLLSTFDPQPLDTPAKISAYFQKLTQNPNLKATVQTEKVHTFADGGVDSGLYTFSYTKDGKEVRVPARFTFVFHQTPTGWLIVSHHSSVVPSGAEASLCDLVAKNGDGDWIATRDVTIPVPGGPIEIKEGNRANAAAQEWLDTQCR